MASRITYEWGTSTGAIRRLRFEIVNIEITQHMFVIIFFDSIGLVWTYEIIGTAWSLKYDGILDLTDLWWRRLPKLMPSRLLLANDSFRKECLSISSFLLLIPTCLKSLWPAIPKTIAVSLYSDLQHYLPNMSCTRHVVLKVVVKIVSSECVFIYLHV